MLGVAEKTLAQLGPKFLFLQKEVPDTDVVVHSPSHSDMFDGEITINSEESVFLIGERKDEGMLDVDKETFPEHKYFHRWQMRSSMGAQE